MYPYNKSKIQAQSHAAAPPPKPDGIFLDLLKEAMTDEASDMLYYENLAWLTTDVCDREIIRHVEADEKKHLKMLTSIYQQLTGEVPDVTAKEQEVGHDLHAEYEKRVLEELEGMEFYRKLYTAHKSTEYRDMFFEMLTDEMAHAIKMLYLRR